MEEKNKFRFVNDLESDIVDDSNEPEEIEEIEEEEIHESGIPMKERYQRVQEVKTFIIVMAISIVLFFLVQLWQDDWALQAIGDALFFVAFLQFAAGWIMLMNNMNILAPLVYGTKTFGRMFIGRRPKQDYYNYMKMKQENPIPKFYYRICFLAAGLTGIPAIIIISSVM